MDTVKLIDNIGLIYSSWGVLLIFLSSLVETTPLGWAIPGGTLVALGGFYAYGNSPATLIGVILAGWLGMLTTFVLAYYIGFKTEMELAKIMRQEKNVEKAKKLLRNHGPVILTTSLLANLTRFWVAYIAGVEHYNFARFTFYAGIASLTWSSLMATVGFFAGSERQNLEKGLANLGLLAWGLLLLAVGVIYWKSKQEFNEFAEEKK